MKQQALRFITVFLSLSCYLSLGGQTSDWYLQVGGGYMIVEQLNQLGFEKSSPSFTGFAEAGRLHQPLSVGVQSTFRQEHGFYRYAIKQQIRSVYVKYSFNKVIPWMPYGLDPYLMAGASQVKNQFVSYEQQDPAAQIIESREIKETAGYTFGSGIQVGSRNVVAGLHYQFTPGRDRFYVPTGDASELTFETTSHFLEVRLAIRLTAPKLGTTRRCPRFHRKGSIRF